ncbi:hypothetical protein B0H13DRAFT_2513500 [Mycena leptocephala]|nr:hypothetical protein B0H13DRAFT_2513500 [Mycena leptocephala]
MSQYTSTTYPPRASSATRTSRGTTQLQRAPHAQISTALRRGIPIPSRKPATVSIDLHTLRPPPMYRRALSMLSNRTRLASRRCSPATQARHRATASNRTQRYPRRAQLLAEAPCAPPIAHYLISFVQHTRAALPEHFHSCLTHPPPRIRGRTPRRSHCEWTLAISTPGYPGRTQARRASTPHRNLPVCACPAHRNPRQEQHTPAHSPPRWYNPSQGRMKIRRGHALTRR